MNLCARLFLIIGVAVLTGCNLIDEDVRDCEADYDLDYKLQLVTNMTTELQTQLGLDTDVAVYTALETYLKNIFTDYAHDVNLSFYDIIGDSVRVHHETHVMDASQSTYSLLIPVRSYMHLAVANIVDNPLIALENDNKCHTSKLHQTVRDTLDSQRRGIFTARLPMDIKANEDQAFNVQLYMANCAASLVLDTLGSNIKDIRVFTSDFATSYSLADSTYQFDYTPVIRADRIKVDEEGGPLCFTAVSFPSREAPDSKAIIDTDEPFISDGFDSKVWQYRVYVKLADGSITETLLGVLVPLRAGQLKVVRARVSDSGAVCPDEEYETTVGVSVTMDWSSGMDWNVPI